MRNLTLRIYDKRINEMFFYPIAFNSKKDRFIMLHDMPEDQYEVMLPVLNKDINGVDVYESDYVMFGDIKTNSDIYVVEYEPIEAAFLLKRVDNLDARTEWYKFGQVSGIKVIGNKW